MRGRSKSVIAKRTRQEWFGRGALAFGAAVLGYFAVSSSLANVVVKSAPALAHSLAPANGAIAARYAQQEFALRPTADPDSPTARIAREALLKEAVAVEALTVLGFQAQLRGDATQSDRLFALSWDLSRRELRSQIWAIEDAVNRGDIAGALHHYDIALRTSSDTHAMLFPVLTAALTEPRIRSGLLRILASQPIWRDAFITYAATSGTEVEGTFRLFVEGRRTGLTVPETEQAAFINTLIGGGKADAAWSYYTRLRPDAERGRSRDPNFTLSTDARAEFDWRIGDEPGLSVAILRTEAGGLVDFSAPPSGGGVVVHQRQLLPPGAYRLEGRSRGIDQPERSQPYWSLTCEDGRELGRVAVENSPKDGGRFAGQFIVPQDCISQVLALMARPSDQSSGLSGQILRALLVPAN